MPINAMLGTAPELTMLRIVKQFRVPFVMSEPILVTYKDDEGETRTYEYAPDFLIMRKLANRM